MGPALRPFLARPAFLRPAGRPAGACVSAGSCTIRASAPSSTPTPRNPRVPAAVTRASERTPPPATTAYRVHAPDRGVWVGRRSLRTVTSEAVFHRQSVRSASFTDRTGDLTSRIRRGGRQQSAERPRADPLGRRTRGASALPCEFRHRNGVDRRALPLKRPRGRACSRVCRASWWSGWPLRTCGISFSRWRRLRRYARKVVAGGATATAKCWRHRVRRAGGLLLAPIASRLRAVRCHRVPAFQRMVGGTCLGQVAGAGAAGHRVGERALVPVRRAGCQQSGRTERTAAGGGRGGLRLLGPDGAPCTRRRVGSRRAWCLWSR
ncbi:hypothetical protein RKD19_000218 [Streptomyces canus]